MQLSKQTTRRNFLKTSSAAATVGTLGIARSAHAAGSEQIRIALIGAGNRGMGATADCLRVGKNVRLTAIADAFESRAAVAKNLMPKYFADQVDVPNDRVFVGLDAYKKALASDVDLAILTTPPGFRPLQYRAAIKAGKHVFMEKPCCVDSGGFRSVMETNKLADRNGLKVGTGFFRRHHHDYLDKIPRIHDGQIGPIKLMRCYCNMKAWGGFPRKPGESEMEYQVRNWRVFDWLGGGRLVESHCHELDVMDWAKGATPVEANGMGGRTLLSRDARFGQDYDHHFHEYTYADGTKMYSQCRQLNNCWEPITEHVHGTKGTIDLVGKIVRINQMEDREWMSPYQQEHVDLVDAIVQGKPYNEGYFGATSSFTGVLGREAAYSGNVVTWDELVENGPDLFPKGEFTWESTPPVVPNEDGNYEHLVAMPGIHSPYS